MANITKAIIKATGNAGSKALTKGSEKAIEKATTKAVTKATEKAVNKALTKSVTRGLTGAGVSSLAPKAGSTLDGILGRSSGLVLPNVEKPVTTSLTKEYANTPLAKTAKQEISEIAGRNSRLLSELDDAGDISYDVAGDIATGKVPYFRKDDEVYDMLRKIAKDQNVSTFADSENQMIDYSKLSPAERSDILDGLLNKENTLVPEYVLEDYAGTKLEPEGLISENQLRLIDQDIAPKGTKIEITQPRTRKKNIDVALGNKEAKLEKPVSTMGVDEAVAETNTPIADFTPNVVEPKTATGGAGMGNSGGTPTATASPDYGGLGDSGFNVHLKEGKNIDIKLKEPMSKAQIKRNRAIRNLDDAWAKSLNATPKQYKDVVGSKSKSAYKGYKTPAEMARLNGVSLDNISETPQAVVSSFENRKLNIEKYAEDREVNVDLGNLDLSNIEPATKATMKMQGIDPDKIKYTGVASPLEAETLYKDLRNRAMKTTDGDRAVAYNTMADYVRNQIDNTMDNLNIDFSAEMSDALGEALGQNADRRYLREIATNKNLKFSDLRREQADWIKIGDLSGRPIKEEPTMSFFGFDTGMKNPVTEGVNRAKEKYYERQAYGPGGAGGAGGNMGGGSVPPLGGSGAENNINFETVSGGRAGTLGNLLGKAKTAGLVGAGVLGGMMLGGGGGGGSNSGSTNFASMGYNPVMAEPEEEIDPYQTMTIGGYTYDQLEAGYTAALMAGDTDAAKLIANMMGMLDDKVDRYYTTQKNNSTSSSSSSSSNSGAIAGKQKAALNVLSGLMQNYSAQGPIGGRFTGFMNTLTGGGYNPAVAAYDSGAQGSLGTIIKALGDTGALSEGDQKRALELLPRTTDSEEAAKYKYQQLIQILQGAGAQ